MTSSRQSRVSASDPPTDRGRWLTYLSLAWLLFLVHASLVPYDFSWDVPREMGATFLGIGFTRELSFADVIGNMALYMPTGMLLCAAFVRVRVTAVGAIASTLFVAATFSFGIEFVQMFLHSRVSSMLDTLFNVLGTGIGLVVYLPESALSRRFVRTLRGELSVTPSAGPPVVWAIGALFASVAPFDLATDASHLAKTVRTAYLMPFQKHADFLALSTMGDALPDDAIDFAAVRLWNLRFDYIGDMLVFVAFGALTAWHLHVIGHRYPSAVARALFGSIGLAVIVTGLGLVVQSVGFDSTRVLTRVLGGLLGAIAFPSFFLAFLKPSSAGTVTRHAGFRRLFRAGAVVTVLYLVLRSLLPFDFQFAHGWSMIGRIEWMPMHAYWLAKLPLAAFDVAHKSFRYLLLGFFVALLWIGGDRSITAKRRLWMAIVTFAAVAPLELLQCWLPGRFPAVTDCLIAAVAATAGVVLGELLHNAHEAILIDAAAWRRDRALLNVSLPSIADHKHQVPTTARQNRKAMHKSQNSDSG